jgi:Uma2 family endonuclease
MYSSPGKHRAITHAHYACNAAREETSSSRHEYIAGQVFALTCASENHELVAGNIFAGLHGYLSTGPCRVYKGDMKLKVESGPKTCGYYPDVMVACTRDGAEKNFLRYPKLIMEVLCPSTRAVDRREKYVHYTQIPTMEEYALISCDAIEAQVYRRADNWLSRTIRGPDASLLLASIDLRMPLAQIYEKVSSPLA